MNLINVLDEATRRHVVCVLANYGPATSEAIYLRLHKDVRQRLTPGLLASILYDSPQAACRDGVWHWAANRPQASAT